MLTIKTYRKLEGLVLRDGLKVSRISELWNAYSIWLSDNTNIELDRDIHWENNNYRYYKMYIGYTGSTAETEFITIESINTLDRMVKKLLYIHDKYKTKQNMNNELKTKDILEGITFILMIVATIGMFCLLYEVKELRELTKGASNFRTIRK